MVATQRIQFRCTVDLRVQKSGSLIMRDAWSTGLHPKTADHALVPIIGSQILYLIGEAYVVINKASLWKAGLIIMTWL